MTAWREHIERVFTFVPPRSPAEAAAHARVREAEENAERIVVETVLSSRRRVPIEEAPVAPLSREERYDLVNTTLMSFALVLDEQTPSPCGPRCECGDGHPKRAAIAAVQLARNAANEALVLSLRIEERKVVGKAHMRAWKQIDEVCLPLLTQQLRLARYHASTAIALSPQPSETP